MRRIRANAIAILTVAWILGTFYYLWQDNKPRSAAAGRSAGSGGGGARSGQRAAGRLELRREERTIPLIVSEPRPPRIPACRGGEGCAGSRRRLGRGGGGSREGCASPSGCFCVSFSIRCLSPWQPFRWGSRVGRPPGNGVKPPVKCWRVGSAGCERPPLAEGQGGRNSWKVFGPRSGGAYIRTYIHTYTHTRVYAITGFSHQDQARAATAPKPFLRPAGRRAWGPGDASGARPGGLGGWYRPPPPLPLLRCQTGDLGSAPEFCLV